MKFCGPKALGNRTKETDRLSHNVPHNFFNSYLRGAAIKAWSSLAKPAPSMISLV